MSADLRLYDSAADRLYDFTLGVTRDRDAAAEVVVDVIVQAMGHGFAVDPSDPRHRLWLYALARAEAFAWLATHGRPAPSDRVIELPAIPEDASHADRAAVAWAAVAAFNERDQALLTLHLRHGLDHDMTATVMGLSAKAVTPLLGRALGRTQEQVGALLALLDAPGGHPALDDVRSGWDGTFSPYVRGRVAAVIAAACLDTPDPVRLLRAVPIVLAPARLRGAVAERLASVHTTATTPWTAAAWDGDLDDTIPPAPASPTPILTVLQQDTTSAADDVTAALPRLLPVPPQPDRVAVPPRQRRRLAMPALIGTVAALGVAGLIGGVIVSGDQEGRSAVPRPALTISESAPSGSGTATEGLPRTPQEPGRLTGPSAVPSLQDGAVTVQIHNSGGLPVEWTVKAAPDWVRVEPSSGTLEAGLASTITLTGVPGLEEGDYTGSVELVSISSADDGIQTATTVMAVQTAAEKPPALGDVVFGSRTIAQEDCGQSSTEVAVTADDGSGLSAVLGTVSGPGPGEQTQVPFNPDSAAPRRYVGVLGPFAVPGSLTMQVQATDTRGNVMVVDAGTVTVEGCESGG